jgi:hypothetical protein
MEVIATGTSITAQITTVEVDRIPTTRNPFTRTHPSSQGTSKYVTTEKSITNSLNHSKKLIKKKRMKSSRSLKPQQTDP